MKAKLRNKLILILMIVTPVLIGCNGFGGWDGGIFREPFTGSWMICLFGKCLP